MAKLTYYTVNCDYSLTRASAEEAQEAESGAYRWIKKAVAGQMIEVGFHKRQRETHYARSLNDSLSGLYL